MVKVGAVVLLVLAFIIYWAFGKPVTLVFMGAFAQGALLPFWHSPRFIFSTPGECKLHPGKTESIPHPIGHLHGDHWQLRCFHREKDSFFAAKRMTRQRSSGAIHQCSTAAVEQPKE